MSTKRQVIDARNGTDGNISHVLVEGNSRFTPINQAISMAARGELSNVHPVHRKNGDTYLRSNPDKRANNNLDEMAAT